jgi:hypothetical protein
LHLNEQRAFEEIENLVKQYEQIDECFKEHLHPLTEQFERPPPALFDGHAAQFLYLSDENLV